MALSCLLDRYVRLNTWSNWSRLFGRRTLLNIPNPNTCLRLQTTCSLYCVGGGLGWYYSTTSYNWVGLYLPCFILVALSTGLTALRLTVEPRVTGLLVELLSWLPYSLLYCYLRVLNTVSTHVLFTDPMSYEMGQRLRLGWVGGADSGYYFALFIVWWTILVLRLCWDNCRIVKWMVGPVLCCWMWLCLVHLMGKLGGVHEAINWVCVVW